MRRVTFANVNVYVYNRYRSVYRINGIELAVWIPVVERVGPHGDPAERRRDGGVVHKELVRHHLELLVTTHSQVRGSNPCKMLTYSISSGNHKWRLRTVLIFVKM